MAGPGNPAEGGPGAMLPPWDWVAEPALHDTNYLDRMAFALRANAAGVIKVTTAKGTDTEMNFAAGETRPGRIVRIWSTGTTVAASAIEVAYQD